MEKEVLCLAVGQTYDLVRETLVTAHPAEAPYPRWQPGYVVPIKKGGALEVIYRVSKIIECLPEEAVGLSDYLDEAASANLAAYHERRLASFGYSKHDAPYRFYILEHHADIAGQIYKKNVQISAKASLDELKSPDMKNDLNNARLEAVPDVRILPMTKDAINGEDPATFFLKRVPRRGGVYYFISRKIASPRGSLVLFQMGGKIIASATLLDTVVEPCRNEDGMIQGGRHVFDVSTIRFLENPLNAEDLASVAPDFKGKKFSQACHKISGEYAAAIEQLLATKGKPLGAVQGETAVSSPSVERASTYVEGARKTTLKLAKEIERNPQARAECLRIQGAKCKVCDTFDSEALYGIPGIIHVHHVSPIALSEGQRVVDPAKDLVPVCPNCHALIHSKPDGYFTVEEAREIVARSKGGVYQSKPS